MVQDVEALRWLGKAAIDCPAAKETLDLAAGVIRQATGATEVLVVYVEDEEFLTCRNRTHGASGEVSPTALWIVQRQITERDGPVAFNLVGDRVEDFTSAFSDDQRQFLALSVPTSESASELCILRGPWEQGARAGALNFMESAMPALTIILERFLNVEWNRRQGEKISTLASAAQMLTQSDNLEAALKDLATAIARSAVSDYVSIDVYDADSERLVLRVLSESRFSNLSLAQAWKNSLDPDRPDVWNVEVMRTHEPFLSPDIQKDERGPEAVRRFFKTALLRSTAVFPMLFQNEFLGTVAFAYYALRRFAPEEVKFLQGFVTQAATALRALHMQKELRQYTQRLEASMQIEYRMARTDALTGVPNRRYADEAVAAECARAARFNIPLSVAIADVDGLKFVNDRWGHSAGDMVLTSVASLARQSCRRIDAVARYGGDEFLFILPTADLQAATTIGLRFRDQVASWKFYSSTKETLPTTVSVGVAEADEDCVKEPALLVARADEALLRAKALGRDRVCPYFPTEAVPQSSPNVAS